MFFAGLDIGSTITKVVIRSPEGIRAAVIKPTAAEHRRLAHKVMQQALDRAGLCFDAVQYIVATGYGRINVPFADVQVTEITCHMRGIASLFPQVRTIIDIGGQDSKGIKVKDGKLAHFVMNDKCAAGTGRFLEIMARALGVELERIGPLSLQSRRPAEVSSICTVFAEQEALLRLSEGAGIEDILAGIHRAAAHRICSMVERIHVDREVALTGGGAKNAGLRKAVEDRLGFPVCLAPEPLLTGALGAALIAEERSARAGSRDMRERQRRRRLEAVTFFD